MHVVIPVVKVVNIIMVFDIKITYKHQLTPLLPLAIPLEDCTSCEKKFTINIPKQFST